MTMNENLIESGPGDDAFTSLDIARAWTYGTAGATGGAAPGGFETCIEAVSTAIGECGHGFYADYMSAHDPVCSRGGSGWGGVW